MHANYFKGQFPEKNTAINSQSSSGPNRKKHLHRFAASPDAQLASWIMDSAKKEPLFSISSLQFCSPMQCKNNLFLYCEGEAILATAVKSTWPQKKNKKENLHELNKSNWKCQTSGYNAHWSLIVPTRLLLIEEQQQHLLALE